jgi:hypothetical protein
MGDKVKLIWISKVLVPSRSAEAVTVLTCVGEVPVSNLARDAEC